MYIHMQCILDFSVTYSIWLGMDERFVDNTLGMVSMSLYNYLH